jgi:hypothetical protein
MNDPRDTGGFVAGDRQAALAALLQAMREPDGCRERARDWLAKRVDGIDGHSSARFGAALRELALVERD